MIEEINDEDEQDADIDLQSILSIINSTFINLDKLQIEEQLDLVHPDIK